MALCLMPLLGCDDTESMRVYTTDADTRERIIEPDGQVRGGGSLFDTGASQPAVELGRVPDGWIAQPVAGPRLLSYAVGGDDEQPPADFSLTRFPGDVGGDLSNVNRWRGQIGLPPIASLDAQESVDSQLGERAMTTYAIGGPSRAATTQPGAPPTAGDPGTDQMIFVSVIREPEATWFAKLQGATPVVLAQSGAFIVAMQHLQLPPLHHHDHQGHSHD